MSINISQLTNKTELRRALLKIRQDMPAAKWREKSNRICEILQSFDLFASSQTILAYFSFRQEPDISPLFADSSRRWGLPRCVGDSLSWHLWHPQEVGRLQIGSYGILEPCPTALLINPGEVDLMIVPSVACDYQRYRLGYGGGYYDRLLSLSEWASKPTIGITFEFAFIPQLPINSWDKPLQNVCTEIAVR